MKGVLFIMPGSLPFTFREGNISEYLAQFILSCLGTCVPVPRQEDIGADFHCTVARRNGLVLTFGSPYIVQIKSESDVKEDKIYYGWHPPKKEGERGVWKKAELEWLFSQENPLLIGIVDRDQLRLSLYSTSALWMAYYKQRLPCQIVLVPNQPSTADAHVPEPKPTPVQDCPANTGDNQCWEVKLGPPLISITAHDIQNEANRKVYRRVLDDAIKLDQVNLWYRGLGVPYLNWVLTVDTNNPDHCTTRDAKAFYHLVTNIPGSAAAQLGAAAPIIASLVLHYAAENQPADVRAFEGVYPLIKHLQHEVMQKALEGAFTAAKQVNPPDQTPPD